MYLMCLKCSRRIYCDAFVTDQVKLEMTAPENAAYEASRQWVGMFSCKAWLFRDILQREDNARRHTPGENRGRKESNSGDANNDKTKLLTLL